MKALAAGRWLLAAAYVLLLAGCIDGNRPARLWRDPPPVVASDPFAARVDAARRQLEDGMFDQARLSVEQLIVDGAKHPLVPLMRARLAEHDEDWAGCISWAHQAVEASPSWGEPRVLLARACLEAGRVGDADAAFADVDRLMPDSPWGPYGRAWVAAKRMDQRRAGELADEAISRDPDHVPSLQMRAGVARLTGDPATEERLLRRAVALAPDAGTWARLGELAEAAGRRLDAARAYELAWDVRPGRDIARRRLELARLAGDAEAEALWRDRAR
jgi:predicted Zn-dependent protease